MKQLPPVVLLIVLIAIVFSSSCRAEIIQAPDVSVIEAQVKDADSNTLVIFDVDDVLMIPKDEILKPFHGGFREGLIKAIEARHTEAEVQELWSLIWQARRNQPVDEKLTRLINMLSARGVKCLALTNAWTGPFGKIKALEDWRRDELTELGYAFKDSWDGWAPKAFLTLRSKDPRRFPLFKEGIVFTCGLDKGNVLKEFLAYGRLRPVKIIFVDDKSKHLESVATVAKDAGIDFTGIEYTAVEDTISPPLNEARAKLQFTVLEQEKTWLSDAAADDRMAYAPTP